MAKEQTARRMVRTGVALPLAAAVCLVTLLAQPEVASAQLTAPLCHTFADDQLIVGVTEVKAIHFTQLRDCINQLRVQAGLPAATWTDPTIQLGGTEIKIEHVNELRTALDGVYVAIGRQAPTYSETLQRRATVIKAVHIAELRTGARALTLVITVPADRIDREEDTVSLQVVSQDTSEPITYSAQGLPPDLTLDATRGFITGRLNHNSAGIHTVTVRAATATRWIERTFRWVVLCPVNGYSFGEIGLEALGGGGDGIVRVTARDGCPYSATSQSGFIRIGEGGSDWRIGNGSEQIVQLVFDNNPGLDTRVGYLSVAGQNIVVSQRSRTEQHCQIVPHPDPQRRHLDFAADFKGVYTFGFKARHDGGTEGCDWMAASDVSWAQVVDDEDGDGDGEIKLLVQRNHTGDERNGQLTINDLRIGIRQAEDMCTFDVDRTHIVLPAQPAETTQDINVTAPNGCGWDAYSLVGWLEIDEPPPAEMTGSKKVRMHLLSLNDSPLARIGTLIVAGHRITVTQCGVGGFCGSDPGGEVSFVHTDAIGSVRMVTNGSGGLVERYDYLPFGSDAPGQPDEISVMFAGKEREEGTAPPTATGGWAALDYFGARYYQSLFGRFTTPDPVVPVDDALLDSQRWNRYTYVRNNPFRYVDPDGRAIETIWDVASLAMSIKAVRDDPTSIWNWVAVAADAASLAAPGLPAVGSAIRVGNAIDNVSEAATASKPVRRIGETGNIGEQALAALGGDPHIFFRTTDGARFVDRLAGGVAHESKVGYTTLTASIRRQIRKDAELLKNRDVKQVRWHFFKSPVTGKAGASQPLLDELRQHGIEVQFDF